MIVAVGEGREKLNEKSHTMPDFSEFVVKESDLEFVKDLGQGNSKCLRPGCFAVSNACSKLQGDGNMGLGWVLYLQDVCRRRVDEIETVSKIATKNHSNS